MLLLQRSQRSLLSRSTGGLAQLLRPSIAASALRPFGAPQNARLESTAVNLEAPKKTPLYELHRAYGAKIVPFANYSMPLVYSNTQSHIASHLWTRSHASIFDVSHMVQHIFTGPGALAFLESLTPSDLASLEPFSSTLSVFLLHPTGGILDDTMITMQASQEQYYVVTNAGCRDKDLAYISDAMQKWENNPETSKEVVTHEVLKDYGLIAVQGPLAKDVVKEYLDHVLPPDVNFDLDEVHFGHSFIVEVPAAEGVASRLPIRIARSGYTGEDGFEISIPPAPALPDYPANQANPTTYITESLLRIGTPDRIQLAGLAARDSLRLEAGLCLYGHDLNENITPPEASLAWVVAKRRRGELTYPGAEVINNQVAKGSKVKPAIKRVGLDFGKGGAPVREGTKIFKSVDGPKKEIGNVTSGGPAISLDMRNIAMGYVPAEFSKIGSTVAVEVRGKMRQGTVVKMPFVPTKYWKGK
ncbi:glycine cleavage system T protein [Peziza echinospora]|nr:glycine cleavage system T protein [Peziza echinospora]